MPQVPHVYLPGPWEGAAIELSPKVRHHLVRVLRRSDGAAVTYTDGVGRRGSGKLVGGELARGPEVEQVRTRALTIVMAAPHRAERARFAVEKLAELGVARLAWLTAEYAQGAPPRQDKARAWAIAALQQSRGVHLLDVVGPYGWSELSLPGPMLVADPDGEPLTTLIRDQPAAAVVIGPEGGFAPDEIPSGSLRCGLGDHTLRSETAAIVAAALVMDVWRRS